MPVLSRRDLWMGLPIGDKLRIHRGALRRQQQPPIFLPSHATRAMKCRTLALEREALRLTVAGEPCYGRRMMRIDWLLTQAYPAEQGLVIRSKMRSYPGWENPIRQRGPR
jgi:hypothetical protein